MSGRIIFDYQRAWKRGASTSRYSSNKGFSSETVGIDLISRPGIALPGITLSSANHGTNLAETLASIIAACVPQTITNSEAIFVTVNSSQDGKLVKIVGGATESVLAAADTGRNYELGITDVIEYKGGIFWTSHTDIAKDGDYDWGSTVGFAGHNLTANKPHPMCIFEDFLIIADGNYIHVWDGSSGVWQALDLPTGYTITAIESFNGLIYIAAEAISISANPFSQYMVSSSKIFTWDNINPNTYLDEYSINSRITALKAHLGNLFIFTPSDFGVFNGVGMAPIYGLPKQIYKHQIASVRGKLFFSYPLYTVTGDFDRVACYAPIDLDGGSVVTFPIMNDYFATGDGVMAILPYGASSATQLRIFWQHTSAPPTVSIGLFNMTFPQAAFYTSVNAGYEASELFENPVFFGEKVKIKKIIVIFSGVRRTGFVASFGFVDSDGTRYTVLSVDLTTYPVTQNVIEKMIEAGKETYSIQAWHSPYVTQNIAASDVAGIQQVIYEYESIEGRKAR